MRHDGQGWRYPPILRCIQIASILASFAFARGFAALILREPALPPPALADLLERLGPTFVKAGQLLSSRPDLVGVERAVALGRLRSHVRPEPWRHVRTVVESTLGGPLEDRFREFDRSPLGAGSVSQVHRAVTRSGRPVAVKVLRPHVEKRLVADVRIARLGCSILARVPKLRLVPWRETIEQFADVLTGQLDLELEAAVSARFRAAFASSDVCIPASVPELSGSRVHTMELVPEFASAVDSQRRDCEPAARVALRTLYKMLFVEGLVHTDLHEGNLILMDDGTIVIVDFGLFTRLDRRTRSLFRQFFLGMAMGDAAACTRVVVATAAKVPDDLIHADLLDEIRQLILRHPTHSVADFEVAAFVTDLFAVQVRFGIRSSPDFATAIMSLISLEGVLKRRAPALAFAAESIDFLLLHRRPRIPAMAHWPRACRAGSRPFAVSSR